MLENLYKKPFYLNEHDVKWVENTLLNMTFKEKIGQLFCLVTNSEDLDDLKSMITKIQPGGMMLRPMTMESSIESVKIIQTVSKYPSLISANLESGGNGAVFEGTKLGSQMQIAATQNVKNAYRLGTVCAREGKAVGINWAFSPIIDIDYNFRNPITNTRTFGSNPELISKMGIAYIEALQSEGLAACIKHFPGDGVDERDQHLVTSINDMDSQTWIKTYGKVFKDAIDAGALTCMIGHIMLPKYSKEINPNLRDEDILPATLSEEIVTKLLKQQLGFNGLVVSDASTMAGLSMVMPRDKLVPKCIQAGCDMFLFTRNLHEDYNSMIQGYEDGIITEERLNDAVTKILGLKAALKLNQRQFESKLIPLYQEATQNINTNQFKSWAKECAQQSITLVKEEKGVLPLTVNKNKRILLYPIESQLGFAYSVRGGVGELFKSLLENEGFIVEIYTNGGSSEGRLKPSSYFTERYDTILYLANIATRSNQTVVRIEWEMPMGSNVPVYMHSIPTIFISVENPYHLIDVPRMRTFINAYNSSDVTLEAIINKLMGKSKFKGVSPVDPFCGKWDTKLS